MQNKAQKAIRLIDAHLANVEDIHCFYGDECHLTDVQGWLDEQPTIDAVLVVRCKDCEFAREARFRTISGNKAYWCVNISRDGCTQVLDADDFCSYGVQKEANK